MPKYHRKRDAQFPAERLGDKQCGLVHLPNGATLLVSYGTVVGYLLDGTLRLSSRYHSRTTNRHIGLLAYALASEYTDYGHSDPLRFEEALARDTGQSAVWNAAPVHFTK